MNRKLTTEERIFLLKSWWKTNKNSEEVIQLFGKRFPQTPPPSRQGIYKLNKRFEEAGSVHDLPRSGRPRTATSEANSTIAESVVQSPKKSLCKRSAEFDMSVSSIGRIMKSLK
uniref:DUF4817 domain-containing protein n=1 Tax=Clastoptera arizonana TaxID=38151 RepID=A0A1B6BYL5_9HEMI